MQPRQTSADAIASPGEAPESATGREGDLDRRAQPTRAWDSFRGWRGRQFARRSGEHENTYVDVYQPRDVVLLLSILMLNVLDAYFTLRWLQIGGREANPVMHWLLEHGDYPFLIQKCVVVGIWLIVLTVHKNFRVARLGLWSLLLLYTVLLVYHFFLQADLGPPPQPQPAELSLGSSKSVPLDATRHDFHTGDEPGRTGAGPHPESVSAGLDPLAQAEGDIALVRHPERP